MRDLNKKNNDNSFVHDEIIDRMRDLYIDCPECESIRHDDDQYCCTTCWSTNGKLNVLRWLKNE